MGLNPVESPEFFRFMRQLLKLSSKCEDHIFTYTCIINIFLKSSFVCFFHFSFLSDQNSGLPGHTSFQKKENICGLVLVKSKMMMMTTRTFSFTNKNLLLNNYYCSHASVEVLADAYA